MSARQTSPLRPVPTGVPAATRATGGGASRPRSWAQAAATGLLSAVASWLLVAVPALTVWVVSPHSTGSFTDAVATGASLWLLGGGGHLQLGAAVLSFVPLLLTAVLAAVAVLGCRRAVSDSPGARRASTVVAWWAGGYAAAALLLAVLAAAGPAAPRWFSLLLPVLALPAVVAGGVLLTLPEVRAWEPVRQWVGRTPRWLSRALLPGLTGAGALLAAGALAVVALTTMHGDRVAHLHRQLDPGAVGGLMLMLLQAGSLPNLALWAVSVVAGPGTQVVQGAHLGWGGYESAMLPMIPVLGALPTPGRFPAWLPVLALLPVGCGVLIGWLVGRRFTALASNRALAPSLAAAVGVAAGALGLLDALGGGSLGADRLSDIGPDAGLLTLALAGELGLGAAAWLGLRTLRRR